MPKYNIFVNQSTGNGYMIIGKPIEADSAEEAVQKFCNNRALNDFFEAIVVEAKTDPCWVQKFDITVVNKPTVVIKKDDYKSD